MPDTNDVDLPSIFVNPDLLARTPLPITESYTINGEVFYEQSTVDSYQEFEVYRMETDGDAYCSTPSGSDSEVGGDDRLQLSLQAVPNGYIVNGSCYLSLQQWNTLVTPSVSVKLLHCVVCSLYCEMEAIKDHVTSVNHRECLNAFHPLERFDLSITRKIKNQYHCAVCNEIFDLGDEKQHFNSKTHEGNLLFAINKVSDLLDDSFDNNNSVKGKETYHFKTHPMNSPNDNESVHSDDYYDNHNFINYRNQNNYDDYEDEPPVFTGLSYATMAKKPKANTQKFIDVDLGSKKVTVRFDSWHMILTPEPNRMYCMVCKKYEPIRKKRDHCELVEHLMNLNRCTVVEAYEEYFIRQVDSRLYHCGHCNNLQLIHEMEDHVEAEHPRKKLVNEAKNAQDSPIKENRLNLLNETHGAIFDETKSLVDSPRKAPEANDSLRKVKEMTAKNLFDSPRKAQMTPKANDSPRKMTEMPTKNLVDSPKKLQVTDSTRKIDMSRNSVTHSPMKAPHLAQNKNIFGSAQSSNNPSPVNFSMPVQFNFESAHSSKNPSPNQNFNKPTHANNTGNNMQANPANPYNRFNNNNNQNMTPKMPGIYDDIVIYPFGHNITIPSLGYNIVCKRPNDFYCGLCDIVCLEAAIAQHIYEVRHLELLQRTPFIAPFTYNLIRAIREALHCAICNIPISAANIYAHLQDPQHVQSLHKALNPTPKAPPKLPPIGVKIPNVPSKPPTPSNDPKMEPTNFSNIPSPNINNQNNNYKNDINKGTVLSDNNNKGFEYNNSPQVQPNSIKTEDKTNIREDKDKDRIEEDNNRTDVVEENAEEYFNSDIEEELERTFDSIASEEAAFDLEEHVYLKLKNSYIKISNTSFNTLVHLGDGSRYCFVCSTQVQYSELQKHADSRPHLENMEKYRFLDKYEDHLLRQIYLMYHCAICNVIITRKELKTHIEWPTHALQNVTLKNIKKTRKTEIKRGVKQIVVSTQKENIYLHENEPKIKMCLNAEIIDNKNEGKDTENAQKSQLSRKNKIIIFNDNVLKVSWDSWHGVSQVKNGYKCYLCQNDLKFEDIDVHCTSEWHRYGLDKPFEKQYAPALIRKINEGYLNCLFCNTEISNKDHIIGEHLNGKKHAKNFENILKDSSMANTYTDCHDDVLML